MNNMNNSGRMNNPPVKGQRSVRSRVPYGPMDCMDRNEHFMDNHNRSDCMMPRNTQMIKYDKKTIMMRVFEYGFVMTETLLYLDTHPDDMEALNYYQEMKEKYKEAVAMYEKEIGPLIFTDVKSDNYWKWVATPMPWEMEDC